MNAKVETVNTNATYVINPFRVILNLISSMFFGMTSAVINFTILIYITNELGDEANGIFQSTLSLLSYIILAEAGIASIYKQKMYKHYIANEHDKVNNILSNYRRINRFLLIPYAVLIVLLATAYPLSLDSSFEYIFILLLVAINGIKRLPHLAKAAPYSLCTSLAEKDYLQRAFTFIVEVFSLVVILSLFIFRNTTFSWLTNENILLLIVITYTVKAFMISFAEYLIVRKALPWVNPNVAITEKINIGDARYQFIHSIAGVIVNSTDTITISIMLGLTKTSIYATYLAINIGVKSILSQMVVVFQTIIGKSSNATGVTKEKIALTSSLSISTAGFAIACISILSVPFVGFFFDPSYEMYEVGVVFAVFTGLSIMISMNNSYYEATAHFKGTAKYSLIEAVGNISLSILFVLMTDSIIGVLIATVITSIFKYFSILIYIGRNIATDNVSVILKNTIRTIIAVGLPVAAVLIGWEQIRNDFDFSNVTNLIIVFALVPTITGIGIFVSSMIIDNKTFRGLLRCIPVVNKYIK